jgi:hypothetical protein
MLDSAAIRTIDAEIFHYRSLGQQQKCEELAIVLALFAATDPWNDPKMEHTLQVKVELEQAVQHLCSSTLDLMYAAVLNAGSFTTHLTDTCLALARDLRQRNPKPRWKERDAEIVRLRDEYGMSFGQIAKRLPTINKAWVGKSGKPLARDSIERAYYRTKGKPQH